MLVRNEFRPQTLPKAPKARKPISSNGRTPVVLGALAVGFAGLSGRGMYSRASQHELLKNQGDQRSVRTLVLPASRGMITDRSGTTLALSAPTESLSAMSSEMDEMPTEVQLEELSSITDMPVASVKERLGKRKDFICLEHQLGKEKADETVMLGIKGFGFQKELRRHYPMDDLSTHVIGLTNIDGKSQRSLGPSREDILRGSGGAKVMLRNNKDNIVDSLGSPRNDAPKDGHDMVLSLDQRVQALAYEELNKAVDYHQAKADTVAVLDAQTGKILTLINSPAYNPNQPGSAGSKQRRSRAVTDMIEPGSAMKPLTIVKALDSGKVNTNQRLSTNLHKIGSATVRDTHVYPSLDLRGIIQRSSNIGAGRLLTMFKPREMYDFYHDLGVGVRMHSGLSSESAGLLHNWRRQRPIKQTITSFGYDLQLSLLQLARVYTMLARNGELLPVSFEEQAVAPEGKRVIKAEIARQIREMMVAVAGPGSTGAAGAVDGFDVDAKTGIARKLANSRYADNKHVAAFVGSAPVQNPHVIMAVTVDEPTANDYHGDMVAGPVPEQVMSGSLNILGVSPTKPLKETTIVKVSS